jgi:hypothetical protein
MLLRDAQLVHDFHHLLLLLFFFHVRTPQTRMARAQILYPSQSIEHSSSIGSPHTSGSISISPKVPNDTTAFYKFSSSLSMFSSIGPITHRYISTARRKTVSLTRKQNLRNSGTTTRMANICFYLYLLHFTFCRPIPTRILRYCRVFFSTASF